MMIWDLFLNFCQFFTIKILTFLNPWRYSSKWPWKWLFHTNLMVLFSSEITGDLDHSEDLVRKACIKLCSFYNKFELHPLIDHLQIDRLSHQMKQNLSTVWSKNTWAGICDKLIKKGKVKGSHSKKSWFWCELRIEKLYSQSDWNEAKIINRDDQVTVRKGCSQTKLNFF